MPEKTTLDWKTYESITKYIYESLGSKAGVKVLGHGNNCKVPGKSGVDHQIDILTSHSDGIHSYRTAIECKYWKDKISKDIVMKISSVIEDAGIEKGVIVSKNGFTKDGAEYAKHKNISLVELREIEETDLEIKQRRLIGTLQVYVHVTHIQSEILGTTIEYAKQESADKEPIQIYQTTIELSNENKKPFSEFTTIFQDELHAENKIGQTITKRYEVPEGSLIHTSNSSPREIKGIIFKGVLKQTNTNTNREFLLEDKVWLLMKTIFEGKTFSITEAGLIVENRK